MLNLHAAQMNLIVSLNVNEREFLWTNINNSMSDLALTLLLRILFKEFHENLFLHLSRT